MKCYGLDSTIISRAYIAKVFEQQHQVIKRKYRSVKIVKGCKLFGSKGKVVSMRGIVYITPNSTLPLLAQQSMLSTT